LLAIARPLVEMGGSGLSAASPSLGWKQEIGS